MSDLTWQQAAILVLVLMLIVGAFVADYLNTKRKWKQRYEVHVSARVSRAYLKAWQVGSDAKEIK